MKITNILLGLIVILLVIAVILTLGNHSKTYTATIAPSRDTVAQKFEYEDFEFRGHVEMKDIANEQSCLMIYGNVTNADGSVPMVQSNLVYSISEIMQSLDNYGWEVVWGDGKNFLVKRPSGQSIGHFIVGMSDVTNSDLP